MDQADKEVYDFIERLRIEAGKQILDSTIPIFGYQGDKIVLDRTGILLRIGRYSFIVTAAHDLEKICEANIPLFADANSKSYVPIQLRSCPIYGTTFSEAGAPDVAAIELNSEIVEQLHSTRHFVTLAEVDLQVRRDSALYAAVGYPHVYFKLNEGIELESLPYCTSQTRKPPDSDTYDAKVHIALELDGLPIRHADGKEEDMEMPRVNGMSGCGIWRVTPPLPFDFAAWNLHKIRLVGIQHSAKRKSYLLGTWIIHVVNRILLAHPELEKATKIKYPRGY